jgi:phenylacetate-CoA ligase
MKDFFFDLKNISFRFIATKAFKDALRYESLNAKQKSQIAFHARKKLVDFAYSNTIFYKSYYDGKGFHPDMLMSERDWGKVPVLEKEMIRENTKEFLAKGVSLSKMNVATTGGSTGKPLKVYKDKSVPVEILGWRSLKWWGVHPGDNHGVVNRSVPKTLKQKIRNYFIWWPTKRIFLDASSVTESNIAEFVSLISKRKIKFLVGYCGSLEKIADYILKNDLKINVLKLVWSTTSPLAKPVRLKMEKAFNCKIMDQYGSVEVFHIAVQKPNEDCLTVNADYIHVDIVDSDNNILNATGEMGDILVTDLYSNNFPIIKYRLGDRSRMIKTIETSDDGFPKLDFVRGRISDFVVFRDGSYLDGAYLTTICDGYEDVIDSYQIYQNSDYNVCLRIVLIAGIKQTNERVNCIINNFSELVKNKSEFYVEFVDFIPDDRGKRRFIISDVKLSDKTI